VSKLERVYRVIRERILNGDYGPGHRLVIDTLEAATDRMQECMECLDVLGFGQANRDFHAIVYARCPNAALVKSLREAARRLDHVRRTVFTHIPYRGVQSIAEHRELIRMLRAGEPFDDVEAFARQHKLNTVEAFRRWHAESGAAATPARSTR
jgi:DNA-binding GntR family transcriptional regulator